MQDQPSTTGHSNEPNPRPGTIPDDFIWDSKRECWYPPGEPSPWDAAAEMRKVMEAIRRAKLEDAGGPGFISAEELFGAEGLKDRQEGRARRKSLRHEPAERDLFSDLADDEDTPSEEQE